MRLISAVTCLFFIQCDIQQPSESAPVQSAPVAVNEGIPTATLHIDGPAPVERHVLAQQWPEVGQLSAVQQRLFSATFNLVPAPCATCAEDTLAACGTGESRSECPVIDTLAARTVRGIKTGFTSSELKMRVNYPDNWFASLNPQAGVHVHLFRDRNGLFGDETESVRASLVAMFETGVQWHIHEIDEPVANEIGVRSRPTWFINGHRFRGVQSAQILSRYIHYQIEDTQPWGE